MSVPSSSGNLLIGPGAKSLLDGFPQISVPSSSGNLLIAEGAENNPTCIRISVPSSSGNLLIASSNGAQNGAAKCISVPSSSGNLLIENQRRVAFIPAGDVFKSPPHRGIFSSPLG